jgi:hypothetical protein
MSNDNLQVVSEQVVLESKNIEVVPYGLKFTAEVSREEWGSAFNQLQHVNTMYQWYLGDLVAQADWQWKGEMYDLMMNITGLERDTLHNLSSISRTFAPEVRAFVFEEVIKSSPRGEFKLSYNHFRIVASLMNTDPEHAVDFLVRAGKQGWTVAVLREQIARWKNGGSLPEPKEKVEVEIPDGWEAVKQGKYNSYVPAPLESEDEYHDAFLVQVYEDEAESLIDALKGNTKFLSLVERLSTGLKGL